MEGEVLVLGEEEDEALADGTGGAEDAWWGSVRCLKFNVISGGARSLRTYRTSS